MVFLQGIIRHKKRKILKKELELKQATNNKFQNLIMHSLLIICYIGINNIV